MAKLQVSKVSVNLVEPPAGLARCKHRHRRLSQSASEAFTCEAAVKCRKGFLLHSPLQLTEHHREWMKGGIQNLTTAYCTFQKFGNNKKFNYEFFLPASFR